MTRDGDGPRVGDEVEIRYQAKYAGERYGFRRVEVLDGDGDLCEITAPMYATVEVLERADDPSAALRGEVREIDGVSAVCYGKDFWVRFSTTPGSVAGYGIFRDEQMVGAPVIGAVPGTPAAEARDKANACEPARPGVRVENTPHGLPDQLRRDVVKLASDGNLVGAVSLLTFRTCMTEDQATEYVEGTSEYQTYLSEHGEKRLRYFKNQYGQRFRAKADGTTEVLMGATWCASNRKLPSLLDDPYMREVEESEALS